MEENKEIGGFLNPLEADKLSKTVEDLFTDFDEQGNEIVGSKVEGYNNDMINFVYDRNKNNHITKEVLEKQIEGFEERLKTLSPESTNRETIIKMIEQMRTLVSNMN